MQNKFIKIPLEAWLTALTTRNFVRIDELINKFLIFTDIYQKIFEFRTRPEELITMYSAALAETDHSTERVMINDLQKDIIRYKQDLADKNQEIVALKEQIRQLQGKQ